MFHLLLLYIKQVYLALEFPHDNFLISLQNWFPDIKLNANFLLPLVVKTAENLGPIFLQLCSWDQVYFKSVCHIGIRRLYFFFFLYLILKIHFLRDALGSKTQTLKNKKLIQKWFKMEGHLLTCLCDCTNCSCFYRSGFISIKHF